MTATGSTAPLSDATRFADNAVSWLCELPDRTSPDDEPEMCLVTGEELHEYLVEAFTEAFTQLQAQLATVVEAVNAPDSGYRLPRVLKDIPASASALLAERDGLRAELKAMTSDRDMWMELVGHKDGDKHPSLLAFQQQEMAKRLAKHQKWCNVVKQKDPTEECDCGAENGMQLINDSDEATRIAELESELTALRTQLRTPGTVEACQKCGVPYEYENGDPGAKARCDFINPETGRDIVDGELATCPLRAQPEREG